ncbi:MAG: hypothetical protein RBU30_10720 [Polyangia bacterium]|jgi:hypothetical protein|nr:hypothetical protein [Polyangia bacterium]
MRRIPPLYRAFLQALAILLLIGAYGCSDDDSNPDADAQLDAAPGDAGLDAEPPDGDLPDGGLPDGCLRATGPGAEGTDTWLDGTDQAQVSVTGPACGRSFTLSTTQALRDNQPANPRLYSEVEGWPSLSTNNLMFDALYALALVEVRQNSVASIQDGAYNGGQPITCPQGGCFETGRLWTFVWTRDTSYAVDLALGALDPVRAMNSLLFKVSDRRGGGSPQIVQDTGSGGSYPVSSDRAVWAFGAARLLHWLGGQERQTFASRALEAVIDTVMHDREVVFDARTGLYRGEQSFLDWREQSYPSWTGQDTAQIAMSQSLSTNLGHLALLRLGASLAAEAGDVAFQTQAQTWASELSEAIHATLFHQDLGLWGTFTTGTLDPSPVRHFDLLGTSLAVLAGLGDVEARERAVRGYPQLPPGPPVIWPQQKETAIYHNRGIWPFVTAYYLRAAKAVRNDAAVTHNVHSLVRGAALNLSNMENFEAVTGDPWHDDGAYSGPVVNSQRQLWSVAGYLSMVHDVIFGLESSDAGIRFQPYVPRALRAGLFGGADTLVLNRLPYQGKAVTVVIDLPPVTADRAGAYGVGSVLLNGAEVGNAFLAVSQLQPENLLEVTLVDQPEASDVIALVSDTSEYRSIFAPLPPEITGIDESGGHLRVLFQGGGEPSSEIVFDIYRDGLLVASELPGGSISWVDPEATAASPSHCYSVAARFLLSGNDGQHARPFCWWGASYERIQTWDAQVFDALGGTLVNNHGRYHYESWGEPGHTITLHGVAPDFTGPHLVQATYGNGAGAVNTGITCAVKRVVVEDEATDQVVGEGLLVMPHLGSWDRWEGSTFAEVSLEASHSYRVILLHDETTLNMSDFEHNALYGGSGGSGGAYHYVNIAELKLLSRVGSP